MLAPAWAGAGLGGSWLGTCPSLPEMWAGFHQMCRFLSSARAGKQHALSQDHFLPGDLRRGLINALQLQPATMAHHPCCGVMTHPLIDFCVWLISSLPPLAAQPRHAGQLRQHVKPSLGCCVDMNVTSIRRTETLSGEHSLRRALNNNVPVVHQHRAVSKHRR